MNWDQIEVKSAEMAHPGRADAPFGKPNGPDGDPPAIPPGDLPEPTLPEALAAVDA